MNPSESPSLLIQAPQRVAGFRQGAVLMLSQVLALMGMLLVAPVLPNMQEFFKAAPHSDLLVPMVMTAPSLSIALLSGPMGWLADRIGLRRVLEGALVLYALCGTAPLYLDSLYLVAASRLGVGVAEAGILTCGTAFMGAYFQGPERKRWLSYQVAAATVAASILLIVTGKIGGTYWRAPFAAYALSLVMLYGVVRYLWEPIATAARTLQKHVALGWPHIARTSVLAIVGGLLFGVAPVELAFLLAANGDANAAAIGLILACGTGAVLAGTLTARQLARLPSALILAGALFGMAGGLLIMVSNSSTPMIAVGVVVQQFSGGVMLPTAIGYALSGLTREQQGRAAGMWWSVYSVAQFLTPVVVNLAQTLTGSLARGIAVLAVSGILFTFPVAYLYGSRGIQRE